MYTLAVTTALFAVGSIFTILYPSTEALLRELPLPQTLRDCYLRGQNYTTQDYVGGLYCWYCETPIRSYIKGQNPNHLTARQRDYIQGLYNEMDRQHGVNRGKRQAAQRCLRKEYRMMTDAERNAFHTALNTLKRDTSVPPNVYDTLALYHTGVATFVAHFGPAFPGWHRVYIKLLEIALQNVNPNVCVPYWDSRLDNGLTNPASSHLWSSDFLGSGQGQVVSGPFANWITPDGPLIRSVGADGMLFTPRIVDDLLSRNTYEEIMLPSSPPRYNFEINHGGPHVFVGGQMARLDAAAMDPTFFLHHAFIDYIFDRFRDRLRSNGRNPEVYPVDPAISAFHLPGADMGLPGSVTQGEGYLEALKDYDYQPSPTCTRANPDCGSKYLWCNPQAQCVPIDPLNPPPGVTTTPTPPTTTTRPPNPTTTPTPLTPPTRPPNPTLSPPNPTIPPRPTLSPTYPIRPPNPTPTAPTTPPRLPPFPTPSPGTTPRPTPPFTPPDTTPRPNPLPVPTTQQPNPNPLPQPKPSGDCSSEKPQAYQNDFCMDGRCDVSHWVWIPVKIVAQRPPEFNDYHSYPVVNSRINTNTDIYSPAANADMTRYIDPSKPKPMAYDYCEVKDGVGKIFVSSKGLSYDGHYKESAIVDQRLATGMSIAFVAVRNPEYGGKTEVLLRAHDQCGRVCMTACRVPGSNPPKYQKCSGVVDVTTESPKMYGKTYAEATLMSYGYAYDSTCPVFTDVEFFMTFYCDYSSYLPWVDEPRYAPTAPPAPYRPTPSPYVAPSPPPYVATPPPYTTPAPYVPPYTTPAPYVPPQTTPTPYVPPYYPPDQQCRLSSECVINRPCWQDPQGQGRNCERHLEQYECVGNCGRYAYCQYGRFWPRDCPQGQYYSEAAGKCTSGPCQTDAQYDSSGGRSGAAANYVAPAPYNPPPAYNPYQAYSGYRRY